MRNIINIGKTAKVKDVQKLGETIRTWTNLYAALPDMTLPELYKAVYLEHKGPNRPKIQRRLLARITTLQRQADIETLGIAA